MFHLTDSCNCVLASPQSTYVVKVQKIVSEMVDGHEVDRSVFVPVDIASKEAELSLPKASDYTLENLLKSGVDLQTLNPMEFFRSTDPFDVERKNDLEASKLFNELVKSDSKVDVKDVKTDVKPEI